MRGEEQEIPSGGRYPYSSFSFLLFDLFISFKKLLVSFPFNVGVGAIAFAIK